MKLNKLPLNVIGLNRVGLNQIGSPSRRANTSARPYIDPEVLASLVAVCICDGKSNNDPDRAVIKNLVDPDNPFVISNAAYKLNSGYGGYANDFTTFRNSGHLQVEYSNDGKSLKITSENTKDWWLISPSNGIFSSCRIKVTNCHYPIVYRYTDDGNTYKDIKISEDGIYNLPKSIINNEGVVNRCCFGSGVQRDDYTGLTIEQLPLYEGAFVTDGKDDLITSTKTVKEMLGGSNEVTVVSMMLNLENEKITYTNQIRPFQNGYIRNNVISNTGGKYGIYGYKITDISDIFKNRISINDILGDRKDYGMDAGGTARIDGKFSVEGYCFNDGTIGEMSQVAWYWTIIAKIALTTDQINQVISYFNLDKHVKPDVYYDVKKQGLSNDTPEADWYLKDFSGNGHDMQLYNFAKKLGSGIGKYEVDFNTWIPQSYVADSAYTSNKLHITNIKGGNAILYTKKGANAMKVKITGIQSFNLVYRYIAENDVWGALEVDRDGIYELPASTTTTKTYYTGFTVPYYTGDCDITIEQIPNYEGALVFDAVDDYGQYVGDLELKDYTIAVDRAYVEAKPSQVSIMSNVVDGSINTPFLMEHMGINKILAPHSFGKYTVLSELNINRFISYQSTYKYNGIDITKGTSTNTGSGLTIGRIGGVASQYANIALWSLLLFPYSLSEFLLERQLKRYKLGTLYPDMVEFRPIIKNNNQYRRIDFYTQSWDKKIYPGDYVPINSILRANIYLNNELNELQSFRINGVNVTFVKSSVDKTAYNIGNIPIAKSPQKIDITIDEYIRFEDIIQPYPAIVNLSQDGKSITWGDKLKVGSDIVFAGSANLLPELYTVSETRYNGVTLYPNTIIKVEKSMVFDNARTYLKANEPNCILSPNRLRIPNSSYKILRYIPDLTGNGNHGRLNNFAYTEESGANEDGSIRIDGTDDHITISNIIGGKCIMAKVTVNRNSGIIYDQRRANVPNKSWMQLNPSSVIFEQNAVSTYIDGILNHNVTGSDLVSKTVNLTCELEIGDTSGTYQPTIGSSYAVGYTTNINLYEFMLFPDVPNEEEIKEFNDIVGIENNIEVS